jgi:hypothetical protein
MIFRFEKRESVRGEVEALMSFCNRKEIDYTVDIAAIWPFPYLKTGEIIPDFLLPAKH